MPKPSYSSGATGALSGAATGAAIGSAVPGIGTAVGAGVGALVGGAAGLYSGGGKPKKASRYTKDQKKLLKSYHQALMSGEGPLADIFGSGDPNAFRGFFERNVQEPALERFREEIVPTLSGQFRGRGLGKSSYFGEALGRAGRDVERNLEGKYADMLFQQQEAGRERKSKGIQSLLGQQQFDFMPQEESSISSLLKAIAPSAGKVIGSQFADMLTGSSQPSSSGIAASPQQYQPYQADISNLPKFNQLPYGGLRR